MNKVIEIKDGIKALIFDVDGTLVDSMPMHFNAWVTVIEKHGIKYTRELFESMAGKSIYEIIEFVNKKYKKNINPEEAVQQKSDIFLANAHHLKAVKAVKDILLSYHGKIPMAAGTGGLRRMVEIELEVTGLKRYFSHIVTAEDVKNHKPAPDTFLSCAKLLNVNPYACQVFEDSVLGLQAANNAGMIATDVRPFYDDDENIYKYS